MGRAHFLLILFGVILAVLPLVDVWNFGVVLVLAVVWFGFVLYLNKKFSVQVLGIVLIFVLLLHAQWGLAQFVLQDNLGLYLLGETRLDVEASGIAKFAFGDSKLLRAYGPYSHANSLGGSLSLGLLLLVVWMLGTKRKLLLHGGFTNVVLVFLLLGIIVSFSRAAYLSSGFTMMLFFMLAGKHVKWQWLLLLVIIVLAFSPLLMARVNDAEDVAVSERLTSARWAWALIGWQGIGVGQYQVALEDYLDENNVSHEPWQLDYVHNVPLLMVVELGLVASMLLAGVALLLLKKFYRGRWWCLLPLLPLVLFDHYLVTQMAPMALVLAIMVLLRGMPARVVH